jgi:hypothetical protein
VRKNAHVLRFATLIHRAIRQRHVSVYLCPDPSKCQLHYSIRVSLIFRSVRLMPPVGIMPVVVVVVVAILGEPQCVHHRPFGMVGIKPFDIVTMPPSGAAPVVAIIVCAPSGLSGCAVIASPGKLREPRRCDRKRQNRARNGKGLSQSVFDYLYIHSPQRRWTRPSRTGLLKPYVLTICVGRAKRGRRRAKRPLSGWIRARLESYIDPANQEYNSPFGMSKDLRHVTSMRFLGERIPDVYWVLVGEFWIGIMCSGITSHCLSRWHCITTQLKVVVSKSGV